MTISLNKLVFIIILIFLLLLVGISGVYGGYMLLNQSSEAQLITLQEWPQANSFLTGVLVLVGSGLIPLVAVTWFITRLCFMAWQHRKDFSKTMSI